MIGIGSLNETALHAALKRVVAPHGSLFEVDVDGYVVDVVSGDQLIEVQTRGLGKLKTKLGALLPTHRVRLVVPVAQRLYLVKESANGPLRRLSPKRGSRLTLFSELVSLPTLLEHPNAEIELLLTVQTEHRRLHEGRARRRRGWITVGRELESVTERLILREPTDLLALIPPGLSGPFTSADLAGHAQVTMRLAQQTAYCLMHQGLLAVVGKVGNRRLYDWCEPGAAPLR